MYVVALTITELNSLIFPYAALTCVDTNTTGFNIVLAVRTPTLATTDSEFVELTLDTLRVFVPGVNLNVGSDPKSVEFA